MASKKKFDNVATGVSVSNRKLIVVTVACPEDIVFLNSYKISPIAAGIVEGGIITDIKVFSQSLRKNFNEWNFNNRLINLSVSAGALVAKVIEIPKMKKREIYNFFKADMEEHPLMLKYMEKAAVNDKLDEVDDDLPSVALTYSVTSYNEDLGQSRYFLMGSPIELFHSFQKTFKVTDKDIESFSSDSFGVLAFLQLMKPLHDESIFVLYVSDECTEFIVAKALDVLFYHKANFNSKEILKQPLVIADVFSRIQMLLLSYQDKFPEDNNVEKIILVSNSSEIADVFRENLEEMKGIFDKPIHILNPLMYINTSRGEFDKEVLSKDIYQLLPAIGSCIAAKKGYPVLDFLKNKSYSGPIFSKRDFIFSGIVAVVAIVAVFLLYTMSGYYVSRLDAKLAAIRDKLLKSQEINRIVESGQSAKIKSDLTRLQSHLAVKISRIEYVDTLTELMPEDLWLEKLDIKTSNDTVVLLFSGKTTSRHAIELFSKNLNEEYDKVEFDMVKLTATGTEFALKCTKGRD